MYIIIGILTIYNSFLYRKRKEKDPKKDYLYIDILYKIISKMCYFKDLLITQATSPYYHKLLPDLEPGMIQKTLVLNLEDTIVKYNYKMGVGFEIYKRPGLNKFLLELSNHYEIVIFSTQDSGVYFLFSL